MNIQPISEWTLYRYRFVIGYAVLALISLLLLTLFITDIPPGLSLGEQQSVITSSQIVFDKLPTNVIDLPYHILQKFSVEILGVTPLGVRLPSLILGAFTALFLVLIMHRWFKTNVALVASIIIVSSAWFISITRQGTPEVMIAFWTSFLLLGSTYVSQQVRTAALWKALCAVAGAFALYTPFMIYFFFAALLAGMVQPHLRFILRESSKVRLSLDTLVFVALLAPLGWGIYQDLGVIRQLLAVPAALPEPLQFLQAIAAALSNLVHPLNVQFTERALPLLSLAAAALLGIGAVRLLTDFHSVRSYLLLIWAAILIPIIGFNPNNLTVLFVPTMVCIGVGIHVIIRYWYKLFPRNPYARIFGLVPLVVLVVGIVQFNYQRYFYGMLYSPQVVQAYSPDAFIAQKELNSIRGAAPAVVVVAPQNQELYTVMAKQRVTTQVLPAEQAGEAKGTLIIAESEVAKVPALPATPTKLLVTDTKEEALRFRVYQR